MPPKKKRSRPVNNTPKDYEKSWQTYSQTGASKVACSYTPRQARRVIQLLTSVHDSYGEILQKKLNLGTFEGRTQLSFLYGLSLSRFLRKAAVLRGQGVPTQVELPYPNFLQPPEGSMTEGEHTEFDPQNSVSGFLTTKELRDLLLKQPEQPGDSSRSYRSGLVGMLFPSKEQQFKGSGFEKAKFVQVIDPRDMLRREEASAARAADEYDKSNRDSYEVLYPLEPKIKECLIRFQLKKWCDKTKIKISSRQLNEFSASYNEALTKSGEKDMTITARELIRKSIKMKPLKNFLLPDMVTYLLRHLGWEADDTKKIDFIYSLLIELGCVDGSSSSSSSSSSSPPPPSSSEVLMKASLMFVLRDLPLIIPDVVGDNFEQAENLSKLLKHNLDGVTALDPTSNLFLDKSNVLWDPINNSTHRIKVQVLSNIDRDGYTAIGEEIQLNMDSLTRFYLLPVNSDALANLLGPGGFSEQSSGNFEFSGARRLRKAFYYGIGGESSDEERDKNEKELGTIMRTSIGKGEDDDHDASSSSSSSSSSADGAYSNKSNSGKRIASARDLDPTKKINWSRMMQLFERINFDVWGLQPSNQLSILRVGTATREDIIEVARAFGLPSPDDLEINPTPYIKKLMDTVKKKAKRAAKKSTKKRDGPEGEYCAICGGKLFKGGRKGDKWDDITNAGQSYTKDVDHIANLIYNTLLFLNNTGLGFLNTHRHCNQAFKSAKVWSPSYDLWLYLLQKATGQQSINEIVNKFEDAYPWPGRLAPGVLNRPMPPGGWRTFCVVNFQSQLLMSRFYKRNQGSNPGLQLMKNGMFVSAKNKSNATGATLFNEGMGYYQYSAGMLEKLKKVLPIKERQMNACEVEAVTLDRWIGVTENNREPQGDRTDTRNDTSLEDRQRRMALIERVCNAEDIWFPSRVGERGSKILEQEYTVLTRVFPVMELISEVFHEESNLLRNRNLSKFLMSLVLNDQMDTEEKRRLESILGILANDKFNTNLAELQEQYSERESGTGIGLGEGESWMGTDGGATTTVSRQVFYDGVEQLIAELGGITNLWLKGVPYNLPYNSQAQIINFFFQSLNGRQTEGLIQLLGLAQKAISTEIDGLTRKLEPTIQEANSKYDVLEAELLRCKEVMGDLGDEYIQKLQRFRVRGRFRRISKSDQPMDDYELGIWQQIQAFNEQLSGAKSIEQQKEVRSRRLGYLIGIMRRERDLPVSNTSRKELPDPRKKVSWRYKNNNQDGTTERTMRQFIMKIEGLSSDSFRNTLFNKMKNKFEECLELEKRLLQVEDEIGQLQSEHKVPAITGLEEQINKNEFMLWILNQVKIERQQRAKQAQEERAKKTRTAAEQQRPRSWNASQDTDNSPYQSPSKLVGDGGEASDFSQDPNYSPGFSGESSAAAVGKGRKKGTRQKRTLFGCSFPSLTYNPTGNDDEIPINFTVAKGEENPTPYQRMVLALRVALVNGDFDTQIKTNTGMLPKHGDSRVRSRYGITGVVDDAAWGTSAIRQPRMIWHFLWPQESPFLTEFFSSERRLRLSGTGTGVALISGGAREVIHWWTPALVLSALQTLCGRDVHWEMVEQRTGPGENIRYIIENRERNIRLALQDNHWYVYTRNRSGVWFNQWNSNGGDCGPGAVIAAIRAVKQPEEDIRRQQFVSNINELVETVIHERQRVGNTGQEHFGRGGKRTRKKKRKKEKTKRRRKYNKKTKGRKRRRKKRTRRK